MLEELELRDLGPIHDAKLVPARGMTSITGETGAGKSMLLSALRLISGAPADASRVATGAKEAWAQGIFVVNEGDAALAIAQQAGAQCDDHEIFVARTVPASGRSRAILCGKTVPKSVLASLADELITIHGQSEQLRIASPARQREFLDRCADNDKERLAYAKAWNAYREIDDRLHRLSSQESSMRQQADYLRESIARIDRVDPQPGELEELKRQRERIEHAAQINTGVANALAALDASQGDGGDDYQSADALIQHAVHALRGIHLSGVFEQCAGVANALAALDASQGDGGDDYQSADALIQHAVHALRGIHLSGVFEQCADRLESARAEIEDVTFTLSQQLDLDSSGEDLDTLNGRIHELDELTRRWGPTLDDVIAWRDKARFDVEDLDASPEKLTELAAQRDECLRKAHKAASALTKTRERAAKRLSKDVDGELAQLAMAGSSLTIEVRAREGDGALAASALTKTRERAAKRLSKDVDGELAQLAMAGSSLTIEVRAREGDGALDANGGDDVEFLFTPFKGSSALAMGKSASGGELSRLMLALELSAAGERAHKEGEAPDGDEVPRMTFIFDEVDAGVGGKAAVELGRRLARLARRAQVIVVTHLPQVASWADSQYVVGKKEDGDGIVSTHVREVIGDARTEEIARMLDGSTTATSLDHARELLASSKLS